MTQQAASFGQVQASKVTSTGGFGGGSGAGGVQKKSNPNNKNYAIKYKDEVTGKYVQVGRLSERTNGQTGEKFLTMEITEVTQPGNFYVFPIEKKPGTAATKVA